MSEKQDFINEFVAETGEGLQRIDNALILLETNGDKKELDVVFRALHTIKGNSGFLDLPKLGAIAHAGETLLSRLIASTFKINAEIIDLLLRLVDAIRTALAELESTGVEGSDNHSALKQELAEWTAVVGGESAVPVLTPGRTPSTPIPTVPASASQERPTSPSKSSPVQHTVLSDPELPHPSLPGTIATSPASSTDKNQGKDDPKLQSPTPPASDVPQEGSGSVSEVDSKASREPESSSFIRVPIELLGELMDLVGELVLARNRIVQIASTRQDDELTEPIQRIHRLTTALQDGVMRTRMQPVRNAWRKYPRIVRDLAKRCGKQCELELQGGDTELDKSMLEAIADPLVHLVRNAIDHGIEKPYLRRIKGKPETGKLLVRAFQESGQVHIEVTDDGAGLDLERIRQKAIEVGVISPEKAMKISETDLRNSVFLPGFSTADQVTNMSGRGVGMDVVKTCVEQIGGTIELQTQKDIGTTIRLTVPLTLAIVPAIMVYCGKHWLAIPQINVMEMLRLQGDEERKACDFFCDAQVLRLRGELVPMANLSAELGLGLDSDVATRDVLQIVVLKSGTRRFALLVDRIGDPQEIVVKPLGELLAKQTEYSGAALMGDGTIALILDVLGIARRAGLLNTENGVLNDSINRLSEISRLEEQVLICEADGNRQIALPLADVVCLEDVPLNKIEHSATGDVVQFRDSVLQLHPLSGHSNQSATINSFSDPVPVVVYRTEKSQMGLLVDRIVDVAPRPEVLCPVELGEISDSRHRVVATAVVLGRITDFLEVN